MKIFPIEIEDGISDVVACDHIATCSMLSDAAKADVQSVFTVPSELGSDVMRFHSILVTTNWNRNDDVFTPVETWAARNTPVGKPVNMDHDGREIDWRNGKPAKINKIIGCMVGCKAVDEDYQPCDETDSVPPSKFHLMVAGNVWEYLWPTAAKKIKEGIDNGTLYVSMECKFNSFGYAIRESVGGEILLVPRNQDTAWLTKHLRKFKGSGKAEINGTEFLIGRWLRDIVFVGMGIVNVPGNPESIIFDDYVSNVGTASTLQNKKLLELTHSGVLSFKKENILWAT